MLLCRLTIVQQPSYDFGVAASPMTSIRRVTLAILLSLAGAMDVVCQTGSPPLLPGVGAHPLIGGVEDDWDRMEQVVGQATADGYLLRSPSSRIRPLRDDGGVGWAVLAPTAEIVWNSSLPFSINHGPMWAGRGYNASVLAGIRLEGGPLRVVIAPQVVYSENRPFQVFSLDREGRSQFASPWHSGPQWGDLPLRHGDEPFARLYPGQSALIVAAGPVEAGAATENQWWGPGVRTAILMSSNAPGFPHAFLRTAAPLRTPFGAVEGRWIVGGLSESDYFDADPENDLRSLSGAVFTLQPARTRNVTVGIARVVYRAASGPGGVAASAADVFTRWEERVLEPLDPGEVPENGWPQPASDVSEQMFSLFGRVILPSESLEIYAEWARTEVPASVRDLISQPNHSQGYSLGGQWIAPIGNRSAARLHAEVSYLEESATYDTRPVGSFYLSRSVPQGYTHRGRVIGAATGPGSSSQWLTADFLAPGWRLGLTGGRIRWENDEYYRVPLRLEVGHDVSVFGGIRAGVELLGVDWAAEVLHGIRLNYLFQNAGLEPFGQYALDVTNTTLRLSVQPMKRVRPTSR
jgi:hypothetical protein